MNRLPKLYAPVNIRFSSLRNGLGSNYGVISDIDTMVDRKCRRVCCEGGWKWQILGYESTREWDYHIETDQEILSEYGSEIEVSYLKGAA